LINESWGALFKRLLYLSLTAFLLAFLAPFIGLIALAVRLTSVGPVFDRQERIHLDGSRFRLITFRTTVGDGENVTRLGIWLRRFSFDLLPQLWNVLRGDMTLGDVVAVFVQGRYVRPEIRSHHCEAKLATDPDNWLKTGGFLIPKQYREPMLGDLIEDRTEMRNSGFSVLYIEGMTILQLLVACACRPKLWISALLAWLARAVGTI
jgi:hypothetical protein